MTRLRALCVLALAATALLAVSAPATAAVRVKVSGSSARPSVGERWTLSVNARKNGKPVNGRVTIDVLMNGKVVYRLAKGAPIRRGRWSHTQKWPKAAGGLTITIRATVTAGGQRGVGSYRVSIRR